MPFDAMTASAKLDATSGDLSDFHVGELRAKYPELGFVFDLLQNMQDEGEETEEKHAQELKELADEAERLAANVGDLIQQALNYFSEGEDGETMGLERRDAEEIWPMLCEARRLCEDFET